MIEMLDNLKERPHHERRAISLWITIGIIAALFIVWAFHFFQRIQKTDLIPDIQLGATSTSRTSETSTELRFSPSEPIDGPYLSNDFTASSSEKLGGDGPPWQ